MLPTELSDTGSSSIDLISAVGTWVAAVLAVIALVGIVGPILAIRAAKSDENRALNALRDQEQRYITKGLRINGQVTIFRRVNVPNLAPTYDTNRTDVPNIARSLSRGELLIFSFPEHKRWNSGWAMLAATIEAYQGAGLSTGGLANRRGGSWEVINTMCAIVVSKYWILFLGLLGRYTDVDRNQAHFGQEDDLTLGGDAASDIFERRSIASDYIVHRSLDARPRSLFQLGRGRYVLGTAKGQMGRPHGSRIYGRGPNEAQEMLHTAASAASEVEVTPLRFHFWIANGFIPFGPIDKYDVLSILDPKDLKKSLPRDTLTQDGIARRLPQQRSFALQKLGVSQEIRNNAIALNETSWRALRWVAVPSGQTDDGTTLWYNVPHLLQGFFSIDWHHWGYLTVADECEYWASILHSAADLLGTGKARSGRRWDEYNYRPVWDGFVPHVQTFLHGLPCDPTDMRILDAIFDWESTIGYHPVKTKEYVDFIAMIDSQIPDSPFRESVYTLLRPLSLEPPKEELEIPTPGEGSDIEVSSPSGPASSAVSLGALSIARSIVMDMEDDYPDHRSVDSDPDVADPGVQETISQLVDIGDDQKLRKLVMEKLMVEKLENKVRRDKAQRKRKLKKLEREKQRRKTAKSDRAAGRAAKRKAEERRLESPLGIASGRAICRNFTFSVTGTTLTVRWQHQALRIETSEAGWPFSVLDEEVVQEDESTTLLLSPAGEQTGNISDRDIVLIALWAAARCVLWLGSDSSAPLIKFVNNLDRHVFVM
ncbi:hypothetical protein OQA88_11612 [Cercophora sp. LCS_1]